MAKSERLERGDESFRLLLRFAKQVGFFAFSRWAKNQGYSIESTLCIIRSVY